MIEMAGLTKLIVCVLIVIAAIILGIYNVIAGEAVVGLLSGVLGYVYGNGHGIYSAKKSIQKN